MLDRDRFAEFFAATNGGHEPFAWQCRLLDHLLQMGRWPEAITAPTGAGKTSVIDVHTFAQALSRVGAAPRLPRRLTVTVNRRSIVDSHLQRATDLSAALGQSSGGILAEVADALRYAPGSDPLRVVGMRGGLPTDREWVDDPVSCMVIVATPDMWGSRLLFRGYGTSRLARPREAGLLAYDSVLVLDEAHLNRQLEKTARGVGATTDAVAALDGVPGLQVVTTTATPDARAHSPVGVIAEDLANPTGPLARRLTAPKRLHYTATPDMKRPTAVYYESVVERVISLIPQQGSTRPSTVLCVMNTVAAAIEVYRRVEATRDSDRVALWVGRMRPYDLEMMRRERPGLFTIDGDPDVEVLVTTQTVEVGVDIDCAGLVTEIAPGSAIAQRAGRVNRLGRLAESHVVVVGPEQTPSRDALPYRQSDLINAHQWIAGVGPAGDISPWALQQNPPPQQGSDRAVLSALTGPRAEILAETTLDHGTEDDLTFWLRDSLDVETEPVGVVVRSPLPRDDGDAMTLLAAVPVHEKEVFPASIRTVRSLVPDIVANYERGRVFVIRGDELLGVLRDGRDGPTLLPFAQVDGLEQGASAFSVRPGDVLVVDPGHAITRSGIVTVDPPPVREPITPLWGDPDTRTQVAVREPIDRTLRGSSALSAAPEVLDDIEELREELADEEEVTAETLQRALADNRPDEYRLILPPLVPGIPIPWAVLLPLDVVNADPVTRETWSASRGPVGLLEHQSAVASRAQEIGRACGLDDELVAALDLAGAHHDDGKCDLRFQKGVLNAPGGRQLAKGVWHSPQEARRAAARHGLPRGWRHEQASVVFAADALPKYEHRELVLRLVGTSHGHGRPFFPHGPATLAGDSSPADFVARAEELYSGGAGWSDLIDATHRRYGLWGAAYLEALLRAADCQVSKEGS